MSEGQTFSRVRTTHGIEYSKAYSKKRRADRKAARRCLNHEDRWSTHGVRCFECWLVHRVGRVKATELLAKAVVRCNVCEQLVPTGYGIFGEVAAAGGIVHTRCERFPFAPPAASEQTKGVSE